MFDKPRLTLCADDFGLSKSVDIAIIELVERRRLSATSCMVAGSTFEKDARALLSVSKDIDIGLHLTLTDLAPLGAMPHLAPDGRFPSLGVLITNAFTRQLDYLEIKAEIGRQLQRFKAICGRQPGFIDGHQHVHVLPTVRRALLDLVGDGTIDRDRIWIRSCEEPFPQIVKRRIEVPKAIFIALLSRGLSAQAAKLGVMTNDSFRGITGFSLTTDFRPVFQRFLLGPGMRPLAMCHPAMPGYPNDPTDTIAEARRAEYRYFASEEFSADLKHAGIEIGRLRRRGT